MAGRSLGFHSTFTGWIDRQEMGRSSEVVGQGRAICSSGSRQDVHRSLHVPWACRKMARVLDRRTTTWRDCSRLIVRPYRHSWLSSGHESLMLICPPFFIPFPILPSLPRLVPSDSAVAPETDSKFLGCWNQKGGPAH